MAFSLTWLPGVLRTAGLKVAEQTGWTDRGRGPMSEAIAGVICHHTGTPNPDKLNMPTLGTLIRGRSDLAGPLAQLGLGLDGTFYVVAAGRANHAGPGSWKGFSGNSKFIGIEAENPGNLEWPAVQLDAYKRGVAAILRQLALDENRCCGHREYAPGRKPDPKFDMNLFRDDVKAIMAGRAIVRPLIPAGDENRPTLRRGANGPMVAAIQQVVGVEADGNFGPNTEAAVRKWQREHDLEVADGIVGPKTWAKMSP